MHEGLVARKKFAEGVIITLISCISWHDEHFFSRKFEKNLRVDALHY
jgi:hypothetical protein